MKKTFVTVVTGPTASGKTLLAVKLAKYFDGEVISADSMQIYKGMEIASAKPTEEEKEGIRHHLINFLDPSESFSVADYVRLARKAVNDIAERGKLPVIAGGTGLYINSLIDNIEFDDTGKDELFRKEMKELAQREGNCVLLDKLKKIDVEYASKLHENNISRIIRALEMHHISGKKMTDALEVSRSKQTPYDPLMLAIDYNPRELLYKRINTRTEKMLETGLLEEAADFYNKNIDYPTAAQAIGYKELKPYLNGEKEFSECAEKLKQETRKYAKRQLTWFRKDKRINWLTCFSEKFDENSSEFDKIFKIAKNLVKSYRN